MARPPLRRPNSSSHPLCGGCLTVGAGEVFPEVNFTLPAIEVNEKNWPEITAHYEQMAKNILKRAVALQSPGAAAPAPWRYPRAR